jgi:hypothetical protein
MQVYKDQGVTSVRRRGATYLTDDEKCIKWPKLGTRLLSPCFSRGLDTRSGPCSLHLRLTGRRTQTPASQSVGRLSLARHLDAHLSGVPVIRSTAALCPASEVGAACSPTAQARPRVCPWVYTSCSQASTGEKRFASGMPAMVSPLRAYRHCLARHHGSGPSWRVLGVAIPQPLNVSRSVCRPRIYLILRVQVRDRGAARQDMILATSLPELLVADYPAPPFLIAIELTLGRLQWADGPVPSLAGQP